MKILALIQWNKEQTETWENKKIIEWLDKIWVTICYLSPEINFSNDDSKNILENVTWKKSNKEISLKDFDLILSLWVFQIEEQLKKYVDDIWKQIWLTAIDKIRDIDKFKANFYLLKEKKVVFSNSLEKIVKWYWEDSFDFIEVILKAVEKWNYERQIENHFTKLIEHRKTMQQFMIFQ